jgi:hypothetical protein
MEKKLRDFLIHIAEKKPTEQIADSYWDIEKELDELFSSFESDFLNGESEEELPKKIVYH